MKFDKKTLIILGNFGAINPSIQFRKGDVIKTISPTKTIYAKAKLDVAFEEGFCIYDLNRFLTTVSLFDEPELEVGEGQKQVTIRKAGHKVNYTCAHPETITAAPEKDINLTEPEIKFVLQNAVLVQTLKAASILKLENLAITGKEGKLFIEAFDLQGRNKDNFEVEIGETTKDFKVIFEIQNLKLIPADYGVSICKIGNTTISHFKSTGDIDIEYIIAIDQKSQF